MSTTGEEGFGSLSLLPSTTDPLAQVVFCGQGEGWVRLETQETPGTN